MVVDQGVLKVSKMVESISLDVQRQWVPAGDIPFRNTKHHNHKIIYRYKPWIIVENRVNVLKRLEGL